MSSCYEIVSLKSFFLSRVGQDSKISHCLMGPRKNSYKVQYVLELIKKVEGKIQLLAQPSDGVSYRALFFFYTQTGDFK